MDNDLNYWLTGACLAFASGYAFYKIHVKPINRFRRQSELSLKDLNLSRAMNLDRLINVLDVSGAGDKKEKELQRMLEGMPIKVQCDIRLWMGCYQPRETVARTIYSRPEVRKYLREKED